VSGGPLQGSAMTTAMPGTETHAAPPDPSLSNPLSPSPAPSSVGGEHRRAARTNMFIAATAEIGGRPCPVRIRNMSETGALLESNIPLPLEANLTLRRGDHVAAGTIVWSEGHKCGVAFSGSVCVAAWMGRPAARDAEGQKQVDALQAQIRNGAVPLAAAQPVRAELVPAELQQRLAEELSHIKRIIDDIGEELSAEPTILSDHAESMQQFDIVSQSLGHLARLLVAPDPGQAVNEIGMDSLRKRLSRSTRTY
jgi:hypothetical protein